MEEIWKPVKGYEELYQVSNLGRVKSLERIDCHGQPRKEKILRYGINKGYCYVTLCKNGKHTTFLVHRLVAEAFIPNPNNYPQVNHKDENPSNNCVENLEWCDQKYNSNYGTRNKRIFEKTTNGKLSRPVLQYDLEGNFIKEFPSTQEVQRELKIYQTSISACCRGKLKTAYGFKWKYKKVS